MTGTVRLFRYFIYVDQSRLHSFQCRAATVEVAMLVDLLCNGARRVTEDQLCITNRHTEILEQGGSRVTEIMKADLTHAVCCTQLPKGPHQVPRLDRVSPD